MKGGKQKAEDDKTKTETKTKTKTETKAAKGNKTKEPATLQLTERKQTHLIVHRETDGQLIDLTDRSRQIRQVEE
jgi:hypothetical protein